MEISLLMTTFVLLLLLALAAQWFSRLVHLPHASMLILFGAGAAFFATQVLGVDTGLRATNFHDIIFLVCLPPLIFEAAFALPQKLLRANLTVILLLAIVGLVATTFISAVLVYYGIDHPTGFPWIAALLTGALLAPTDPAAVTTQLKRADTPKRLGVIIEGESLFNDATAIVLFTILLELAMSPAAELSALTATASFASSAIGGTVIGAILGYACLWAMRQTNDSTIRSTLSIVTAYTSFLLAEEYLHVSGVMATLVVGLALSRHLPTRDKQHLHQNWATLGYISNGVVFLLAGATITLSMFTERWLAILIAIAAVLIARLATTYSCFLVANLVTQAPLPLPQQSVVVWGGLRVL